MVLCRWEEEEEEELGLTAGDLGATGSGGAGAGSAAGGAAEALTSRPDCCRLR